MRMVSEKTMNGTDASKHQGAVDFIKMRQAGVEFVIIRAGYGETEDKMFTAYINAALMAGLMVGVYWFIYAKGNDGIEKNADKFEQVIRPYKDKITCGTWADWEYDSDKRAGYLTNKQRSDMVNYFCQIMSKYGYETGIYANQDYIQNKFTPDLIKKYPLWYAKYSKSMGPAAYRGKDGHPYIWQYSSNGNGNDYGASSQCIDLNCAYFHINNYSEDNININPYPEPTENVKNGTRGDGAKWVQWCLWRFGLLTEAGIDGVIGSESVAAIKIAQARLRLNVDGIVGKNTRMAFNTVLDS